MDLWISKLATENLCAPGCGPTALASKFEKLGGMNGEETG